MWLSDPDDGGKFPGSDAILSAHMGENPLIAHLAQERDDRWLKISDFVSRRAFQRTTVYNEFYRKVDIEYQIATMFSDHGSASVGIALNSWRYRHHHDCSDDHGSASVGIALNRRLRDFGELDRTVLTLLRPHLVQGYRNARRFTELQADLASITSGADSARVAVIVLGEGRAIRIATARARALLATYFQVAPRAPDVLPPVLDAWVLRHHETRGRGRDPELPAARAPYVIDHGDTRLVIRLIGEPPRLLAFSEERLGVDRRALETLGLSLREAEVLAWLAEGKRDQEIAVILAISPRTVQHHLAHVYEKLGVETRSAAVAIGLRVSEDSLIS